MIEIKKESFEKFQKKLEIYHKLAEAEKEAELCDVRCSVKDVQDAMRMAIFEK